MELMLRRDLARYVHLDDSILYIFFFYNYNYNYFSVSVFAFFLNFVFILQTITIFFLKKIDLADFGIRPLGDALPHPKRSRRIVKYSLGRIYFDINFINKQQIPFQLFFFQFLFLA